MSSTLLFSLEGQGLRLESAVDIEPHLQALRENVNVEEVRFGGNTLGVEACQTLAEVLGTKKTLKVRDLRLECPSISTDSLLVDCESRGYLHIPPGQRDPSRPILHLDCSAHPTRSSHRRPFRQCLWSHDASPARRFPVAAYPSTAPDSEQQWPRSESRRDDR